MLYAFLSALGWSALDALRKQLTTRLSPLAITFWLNLGFVPVFIGWALWTGAPLPPLAYLAPLALSLVVNLGAQLLFLLSLSWSGLGAAIPMLALTPAVSTGIAWVALGEAPTTLQLAGLVLVVLGSLFNASLGSDGAVTLDRGAVAMAAVAVLWSANGVVDKAALDYASPPVHAAFGTGCTVLVLAAVLAASGRLATLRVPARDRPTLVAAVTAMGLAYGLQLVALQELLVGLVEGVKRGLGMPLALLNGRLFFGESVDPRRLGAVAVIIAGVLLLL
jgi:drug/metabolite transporter (DMT)-like permease